MKRKGRSSSAPPVALDVAATRAALAQALRRAGEPAARLGPARRDDAAAVRHLPAWVGRFGVVASSVTTWVWCEPRPGEAGAVGGQLVLDRPSGRYRCDVLDCAAGRWCSLEFAAGGPLVVGVPTVGGAVAFRIRPSS